jgi:hypothetical protein
MICHPHLLLASPINIGVHTSTLEYVSTANISTTPHLHNHGLAMLVCITPFRNMRPPLVYWSHLKRSFEEVIFSSNIIKTTKSSRDEAWKKLQESLQIKEEVNILRGKTLQLQKLFLLWFHFLPLHHTISKTLSKIIWEKFTALFEPSFNLAICMTWVVSFVFTNELHIFSL